MIVRTKHVIAMIVKVQDFVKILQQSKKRITTIKEKIARLMLSNWRGPDNERCKNAANA